MILPLGLLALMYFMIIRPQQQQQKRRQEMLSQLAVGSDVITVGGLHGTVTAMDDSTVRLKVASGVELTFDRASVRGLREKK